MRVTPEGISFAFPRWPAFHLVSSEMDSSYAKLVFLLYVCAGAVQFFACNHVETRKGKGERDYILFHLPEFFFVVLNDDRIFTAHTQIAITDAPRFPWRGVMIDVSRHFLPLELVKRILDSMAALRLNTLHMHLADDQGFRVRLDSIEGSLRSLCLSSFICLGFVFPWKRD